MRRSLLSLPNNHPSPVLPLVEEEAKTEVSRSLLRIPFVLGHLDHEAVHV